MGKQHYYFLSPYYVVRSPYIKYFEFFFHFHPGYLHMLVISAKGLRQLMKTRWFVYDKKAGKLRYYRNEKEEQNGSDPVGEIDITSATFCYDVGEDPTGEFTIW